MKMPWQKKKAVQTDEAVEIMLRLKGTRDLNPLEMAKVLHKQCPACEAKPMELMGGPSRSISGFNVMCAECEQIFNLRPGYLTQIWSWKSV